MNTTRISRRNLIVIGAAFPLSTLVVRSAVARAAAHNGKDHGNATPGASPEASPATNTGTGAAYLTIQNNGSEADRLVSAKSDAAQIVEIHEAKVDNGVMSMKELADGLEIPAGESVSFAPSDLHLMLINLNHSLMPGSTYDLTLTFEHAGEVTIPVVVQTESPDGKAPVTVGNLTIEGAWSRPAPRISDGGGSHGHDMHGSATPEATPSH